MVYDDPLSQKSLKHASNWPPRSWLEWWGDPEIIKDELNKKAFNFDKWLEYKKQTPNDGLSRIYEHPEVEYKLTEDELIAYTDNRELCNPELCPKKWEKYIQDYGEVGKRLWWLIWQVHWVSFGYPYLPKVVWESKNLYLEIFQQLIFNPFIKQWGVPPDDFWVKLSYHFEEDNRGRLHRGFVLIFESQGRIFPPPDLYDSYEDPDPWSLTMPQEFHS
jgi:hypothetical protein